MIRDLDQLSVTTTRTLGMDAVFLHALLSLSGVKAVDPDCETPGRSVHAPCVSTASALLAREEG